jgi:hypothetical protein
MITVVFEYLGHFTTPGPHGNRIMGDDAPYIRTPAETMDDIVDALQSKRPQDVYFNLFQNKDLTDAPRDSRPESGHWKNYTPNFADEIQALYNISQIDDFVRAVITTKGHVSSVILYSDRQLAELKNIRFNRVTGNVLGFDKTFKLGSIYVTPSVYENVALFRQRSNENPIFMGPIFVHGRSDVETYSQFFSHLSMKLSDCNMQQLTLGSDDERAMRKSMKQYFPCASTVVCSCHLKENVGRKLDELIGKSSQVRRTVRHYRINSC